MQKAHNHYHHHWPTVSRDIISISCHKLLKNFIHTNYYNDFFHSEMQLSVSNG